MATSARPRSGKQTTLRHVWLASLGASSIGTARVIDAAGRLATTTDSVALQARAVGRDAGLVLRGAALTLQERLAQAREAAQARVASRLLVVLSVVEMPSARPAPRGWRPRLGRRASTRR